MDYRRRGGDFATGVQSAKNPRLRQLLAAQSTFPDCRGEADALARPIHDGSLFRPFPMQSICGRASSTGFFTA
jgi:hypothetical protein